MDKEICGKFTYCILWALSGDCPVCYKHNTFSVTDNGFERLWYCFHADCHTKGSTGIQLTKENSKVAFKEKITKQETNTEFVVTRYVCIAFT